MRFGNERTHVGCRIKWVADHKRFGAQLQCGNKLVVDRTMNKDTRAVRANFALRIEVREQRG